MKKLILALLFLLIQIATFAQQFESKIDSLLLNVFKDANGPGGVFLVAKAGKPIYQKAFGKANVELNVNMNTANIFQLGSITKQFTAIAILMLEEKDKLSTNDPISKYIPDYPNGNQITIHQLLNHTSGIKDFTKMKSIAQIAQQDLSPKELVAFFKNEPVDFKPGEKFEYNNSGYALLGYIIELIAKETYENFIQKNIFQKLGMKHSRYANDIAIIPNRAYGYQKKLAQYVNKTKISFNIPYSSGSLMSTLEDMLKWQTALNQNLLLKSTSIKKAFTKSNLNNGEVVNYGYGWHLLNINNITTREHGGSIFGFKTMGIYIPSKDIYILGLSNCECNSPTQVTRDIAKLVNETLKTNTLK